MTVAIAARTFDYVVVDVFTDRPLTGNPLAVFLDADGLTDPEVSASAREFNLSETAFGFSARDPSTLAYVRIFTPTRELPFAGHPTIGTTFALAHAGRIGRETFAFEEGVGPAEIRVESGAPFLPG